MSLACLFECVNIILSNFKVLPATWPQHLKTDWKKEFFLVDSFTRMHPHPDAKLSFHLSEDREDGTLGMRLITVRQGIIKFISNWPIRGWKVQRNSISHWCCGPLTKENPLQQNATLILWPLRLLASNFSLQYHPWITYKCHESKGNDH